MYKCLYCDNPATHTKYMVIPGHIIVPNAYDLCDDHEHKEIGYYHIYNDDGTRKSDNLKDILP